MVYDVCVIGAGASGLVAAITAARRNKTVCIVEKNKIIGRKILSTGNGRCNYTNRFMNANCFNCEEPAFVDSIVGRFGCMDVIKFFDELGVIPKYINDLVYPMTNQAGTIVAVLEKELTRLSVDIKTEFDVKSVENNSFDKDNQVFTVVSSNGDEVACKKLIVAFGGKAAPSLGTDGSGNKLLRSLGHTVSFTYPALVGLKSDNAKLTKLAGLRCNASVSLYVDDEFVCREEGEVQFNKDGLSGFPVMQLSGKASRQLGAHKVRLDVNFLPFLLDEQVEEYIKKFTDFRGILPAQVLELEPDVSMIRAMQFDVVDTYGFNSAQVTAGGVPVSEVNPVDMSSKKCEGLYLTGELLDVDGRCGGYNLSFAFATGYIAGNNV